MTHNDIPGDIFVPDHTPLPDALARTTHLCVGAHQDDQEFMAYDGIVACYNQPDKWFTGVCLTHGGGSARSGIYADLSNDEMMAVRMREQQKAALVGDYGCEIQLGYPSATIKDPTHHDVVDALHCILEQARPEVVYLHNPADKHDTHVAALLCSIEALRALPMDARPAKVYGCEIWRSLDWLNDEDKQVLRVDAHPNLSAALCGVFDSQIAGGKRYDTAVAGRRMANATFYESHATDTATALSWGMDLTPLITNDSLSIAEYIDGFINRFKQDVQSRLMRFMRP